VRWLVRGDVDGFFGLALDNLVQLLLIDTLCRFVLGFPPELVYGRVLPGAAVSILVGNLFYAFQARRLAQRTGRTDVCALPYGINTVSLIAHVFLIMLPAKALAVAAAPPIPCASRGRRGPSASAPVIESCVRRSPSGSGRRRCARRCCRRSPGSLTFIALGFLPCRAAHRRLTTLGIVLLYFGTYAKGGLPRLVAVGAGTALAWLTARPRRCGPVGTGLQLDPDARRPAAGLGGGRCCLRVDHRADGALQRRRLAPEHRAPKPPATATDRALARGERARLDRCATSARASRDDLHRPSGVEAMGARRLLGPERRVRHDRVPDRHARPHRVGRARRRRHGDRA
jgi:hypothetical protein